MKKRLISVLLAGTMVLSSFGMFAMADETEGDKKAGKSSEAAPDWDDYNEKIAHGLSSRSISIMIFTC